jgi:hypothetical protein
MQPQGTGVTNPAYFAALTAQINAIQGTDACDRVQALVNQAFASLQAQVTAVKHLIDALLPQTTVPTDLGSVIAWIKSFQAPILKAYNDAIAQLAAVEAAIAALATAIASAASRLLSCTITIPTIHVP